MAQGMHSDTPTGIVYPQIGHKKEFELHLGDHHIERGIFIYEI